MTTGTKMRDDKNGLAGLDPVVSGPPLLLGDPVSLGDIASLVIADLSVRLSGEFQLPRLVIGGFPGGQKPADR